MPFIISAVLVIVGLYVRFKLAETPVFAQAQSSHHLHRWPLKALIMAHGRAIVLGALAMGVCYHLFYTATVFCLSYGTQTLHIARPVFLAMLCVAVIGMAAATPLAAWLADRVGRRPVLMSGQLFAVALGFALMPLVGSGQWLWILLFLFAALFLMRVTFAPMGAFLPEQFPVAVRYSGAGLSYQLGGILGASFAPAISQALVQQGGLSWVGGYMSCMALISLLAVWQMPSSVQSA